MKNKKIKRKEVKTNKDNNNNINQKKSPHQPDMTQFLKQSLGCLQMIFSPCNPMSSWGPVLNEIGEESR